MASTLVLGRRLKRVPKFWVVPSAKLYREAGMKRVRNIVWNACLQIVRHFVTPTCRHTSTFLLFLLYLWSPDKETSAYIRSPPYSPCPLPPPLGCDEGCPTTSNIRTYLRCLSRDVVVFTYLLSTSSYVMRACMHACMHHDREQHLCRFSRQDRYTSAC